MSKKRDSRSLEWRSPIHVMNNKSGFATMDNLQGDVEVERKKIPQESVPPKQEQKSATPYDFPSKHVYKTNKNGERTT